jgi:hypothetical protein
MAGMLLGRIFRAVGCGDHDGLASLLAENAASSVDLNTRCPEGKTVLHLAASMDRPGLVALLAGAGADVDALSGGEPPRAETPLLLATQRSPAAALELLRLGARADLCDAEGRSPVICNEEALAAAGVAAEERRLREHLAAALRERLSVRASPAQ